MLAWPRSRRGLLTVLDKPRRENILGGNRSFERSRSPGGGDGPAHGTAASVAPSTKEGSAHARISDTGGHHHFPSRPARPGVLGERSGVVARKNRGADGVGWGGSAGLSIFDAGHRDSPPGPSYVRPAN